MRKTIILTLILAFSMGMRAADFDYLVFTMTDGSQKTVAASNLTMTFSEGSLIASNGTSVLATLDLSLLSSMEFSSATSDDTAIRYIDTNTLITDDATTIYDMNGRVMPNNQQLPQGIYIVSNNRQTIKVHIK